MRTKLRLLSVRRRCGLSPESSGLHPSPLVRVHPCPSVSPKAPIPVVCAVIESDSGHVLVAQRPAHKHLGLKWEFAGGKVEPGEAPEAALIREIKEELACDIAVMRSLPRFTHDYGAVVIAMIPFVCRLTPGSPAPHPHEHVAVRWVSPAELATIDLAAADLPVVAAYAATRSA